MVKLSFERRSAVEHAKFDGPFSCNMSHMFNRHGGESFSYVATLFFIDCFFSVIFPRNCVIKCGTRRSRISGEIQMLGRGNEERQERKWLGTMKLASTFDKEAL